MKKIYKQFDMASFFCQRTSQACTSPIYWMFNTTVYSHDKEKLALDP